MSRKLLNTGIYCFENQINGKKYIGQAHNVERRICEHEYHLQKGSDKSVALQRAVNKYGIENFKSFLIENCAIEDMSEREVYWISHFKSNDKQYGYNLSSGGEKGLFGYKHSPETGAKISAAKKGWKMSEEQKQQISKFQTGKIVSDETRSKMSENHSRYWSGKTITDEHRGNLREAHGGENAYQFGKKSPNASSKYYGVGKVVSKGHTYWSVNIKNKGERIYVGASKDEIEAAKLYDAYVIENNLPNPLNFPGSR